MRVTYIATLIILFVLCFFLRLFNIPFALIIPGSLFTFQPVM